jgi:hypothetical protein
MRSLRKRVREHAAGLADTSHNSAGAKKQQRTTVTADAANLV